jgi:hypothetical protein
MMTSSKHQAHTGTTGVADATDLDALMQANIVRVFNERNSDRRPRGHRSLHRRRPPHSGHVERTVTSRRAKLLWLRLVKAGGENDHRTTEAHYLAPRSLAKPKFGFRSTARCSLSTTLRSTSARVTETNPRPSYSRPCLSRNRPAGLTARIVLG